MANAEPQSKEEILQSFNQLVRRERDKANQLVTKAEEAERARDKEIVETASTYTVESIVKGLADLQLSFAASVAELAQTLEDESSKLDQLERAINVENTRLGILRNILVAAEAHNILEADIAKRNEAYEESAAEKREALDEEINSTRERWTKDQEEHDAAIAEYEAKIEKDRLDEAENHEYTTERERKLHRDALKEERRLLDRSLAEKEEDKRKNWGEREADLAKVEEEIAELRAKAENFDAEKEEAVNASREDAIKKASREAKIQAELAEKEVEANTEVFELQISTLETTVGENNAQIQKLLAQLQVALDQTQELAVKAIEGSAQNASH